VLDEFARRLADKRKGQLNVLPMDSSGAPDASSVTGTRSFRILIQAGRKTHPSIRKRSRIAVMSNPFTVIRFKENGDPRVARDAQPWAKLANADGVHGLAEPFQVKNTTTRKTKQPTKRLTSGLFCCRLIPLGARRFWRCYGRGVVAAAVAGFLEL
jgi:hypothetical protein